MVNLSFIHLTAFEGFNPFLIYIVMAVVILTGAGLIKSWSRYDKSWPPPHLGLALGGILAGITTLIAAFQVYRKTENRPPAYSISHVRANREGLKLRINPTTFVVEKRQGFILRASHDFDSRCDRVSGKIEELGYEQEFTRTELLNGISSQINPRATGTFQFRFFCDNDKEIGSVAVAVTLPSPSSQAATIAWVLDAGMPIHKTTSFEIPVFIRAVELRGKQHVPRAVSNDTSFTVVDSKGNLRQPVNLTIPKNNAISPPVYIPFPVGADYVLVASNLKTGKQSNTADLKWSARGPKLRLAVYPEELEIYAVPASSRSAEVYLESDGQRLQPDGTIEVFLRTPLKVTSSPMDKLLLSPQAPAGKYQVTGGSEPGTVNAGFQEPSLALNSILPIRILSIRWLLLTAALAGLIGVACGRGMSLFSERGTALGISLVTAAVAGWLLYWALLMQWIPPHLDESALGMVPAAFIGILGGYLGLSVFKVLAAVVTHASGSTGSQR